MAQQKIHSDGRNRNPIVVFDLDGVIATGSDEEVYSDFAGWDYSRCTPVCEVVNVISMLYKSEYEIIIHTARLEEDRVVTEKWLKENLVKYHRLIMNKPFGDLYIDDKAFLINKEYAGKIRIQKLLFLIKESIQVFFNRRQKRLKK